MKVASNEDIMILRVKIRVKLIIILYIQLMCLAPFFEVLGKKRIIKKVKEEDTKRADTKQIENETFFFRY